MQSCRPRARKSAARSAGQRDRFYLSSQDPWESWGGTTRFVIIRLAETSPTILLYLIYLHR